MVPNKVQYFNEIVPLLDFYDRDNQWFGFKRGGQSWSSGSWADFVTAAWKLYKAAATNELQTIVLGDTKIRSDNQLIMSFGLAANSKDPQEARDKLMVADLIAKRQVIAENSRFRTPVQIMGPGSILSAERWSPLLNDSLMIAGIRARQAFHFGLNVDEGVVWHSIETQAKPQIEAMQGRTQFERLRANFGSAVKGAINPSEKLARELWLSFLHKVPRVLWENNIPRVFVRELLGLKLFGYTPVFDVNGLGFAPGAQTIDVTFRKYLDGLNDAGLHRADKAKLMSELGVFLFNDPQALP